MTIVVRQVHPGFKTTSRVRLLAKQLGNKNNSKFLKNQIPPREQNILLFILWKFHLLAIAHCGVIQLPSALGTTCSAGRGGLKCPLEGGVKYDL